MAGGYIPVKQQALDAFAQNFSTLISASPGTYGLMASDAAQIASQANLYHAALTLVLNPATRTTATVADKNGKKAGMLQVLRIYAQMIKLNQGVSDLAKRALGLTINDTTRTPYPVPSSAPKLTLNAKAGGAVSLQVRDSADPTRKAKPAGVQGTAVYASIGNAPPADPTTLPLYDLVTKNAIDLAVAPGDLGKTMYVYGRFYNPAGQRGPLSAMASMVLGGT